MRLSLLIMSLLPRLAPSLVCEDFVFVRGSANLVIDVADIQVVKDMLEIS